MTLKSKNKYKFLNIKYFKLDFIWLQSRGRNYLRWSYENERHIKERF